MKAMERLRRAQRAAARQCFSAAMDLARRQGARALVQRAADSLAALAVERDTDGVAGFIFGRLHAVGHAHGALDPWHLLPGLARDHGPCFAAALPTPTPIASAMCCTTCCNVLPLAKLRPTRALRSACSPSPAVILIVHVVPSRTGTVFLLSPRKISAMPSA